MKRATAIILSLMFVMLQVMASAPASVRPAHLACSCCACKKTDCCVSATAPDAGPLAAIPATTSSYCDLSLLAPAVVTWTLPVTAQAGFSSSDSAPFQALAVPLFTRHCALLI